MAREASSIIPVSKSAMPPRAAYHAAAGECLALGQYYRAQPYGPQALVLYAHCINLKDLDPSREAGAILSMGVRLAYEMGYHRDPDTFGKFSVFESEMRRRFWASCKQVDMMTTFQLGLPSNIRLENCDTRSPRNLLDSDFGPESTVLPPSRPESESTGMLWFIVKDRLTPSFSKVCQDALSLHRKSFEDVRALDEEIRLAHDTIPPLLRIRPVAECTQDSRFIVMARFYIELLHLKSLCILHRKRMKAGNDWSTKQCVKAGLSIVRLVVSVYKEFSAGGELHQVNFMFNNYYMSDFLLGVVVLCLYTNICRKGGNEAGPPSVGTGSEIHSLLEQAHAICVDKSSASSDARKVSLAIRMTLHNTDDARRVDHDAHVPGFLNAPTDAWMDEIDGMTEPIPEDITSISFDMLDPFNFMSTELLNFNATNTDPDSFIWPDSISAMDRD
jgi:hypothetical protein